VEITDAKWAKLSWIYKGDFYLYENAHQSLESNEETKAIRFKLIETTGKESDHFEFVIRQDKNDFFFKADCFKEHDVESPLKLFRSNDEVVLYFEDDLGHGFFRLGE